MGLIHQNVWGETQALIGFRHGPANSSMQPRWRTSGSGSNSKSYPSSPAGLVKNTNWLGSTVSDSASLG